MSEADHDPEEVKKAQEEAKAAFVAGHSTAEDLGFGGSQAEFDEASAAFTAEASQVYVGPDGKARYQEYDNGHTFRSGVSEAWMDADEADFEDIVEPGLEPDAGSGGDGDAGQPPEGLDDDDLEDLLPESDPDVVDAYLEQIRRWESGPEFVNDADRVDRVKQERLRLAAMISEQPHLIADPRFEEKREYLTADFAYNNRPDASSEDFGEFARRRAKLRDEIFQGRAMENAEDYVTFAKRTQNMILEKNPSDRHIEDQYDLIDLRREAVLEHYDDHRFIAAVARDKSGMLDELFVDFDRRDLLLGQMSDVTAERSRAMADVFIEAVEWTEDAGEGGPIAEKVASFQIMREVGRNIRHNQRSIVEFASEYEPGQVGYELGMAALDDEKYDPVMYRRWVEELSPSERRTIGKKNSTAGAFLVAQKRFAEQFDAGDPDAAKSFAIMEQAAAKIMGRPDLQSRLSEIGGTDALSALHTFSEGYRGKSVDSVRQEFEDEVIDRMGDSVIQEGERRGRVLGEQKDGAAYELDLTAGRVSLVLGAARHHVEGIGDPYLSQGLDEVEKSLSENGPGNSSQLFSELLKSEALKDPQNAGLRNLLSTDLGSMSNDHFRQALVDGVRSAGTEGSEELASKMATRDSIAGVAEDLGVSVVDYEPSFEVVDGGHLRMANNQKDLEAGKGLLLRLDGIVAPPPGAQTKNAKFDAGEESRSHLEEVIQRHGIGSLGMNLQTLESGETVLKARLSTGEDLSQRMLHDGFVLPSGDGEESLRRESMAKQAEVHGRGLWGEGFPDMDQSWRREKGAPEMTWRDTRLNLTKTVAAAMAGSTKDVFRKLHLSKKQSPYAMLSQSEQKLFALPLLNWSGQEDIDRQIRMAAAASPARLQEIYGNNQDILNDLRKRKDKLSQDEKVAHDRLTLGSRALGNVLVEKNLLDGKEFKKDDDDLLSRRGLEITKDGVRMVGEFGLTTAKVTGKYSKKAAQIGTSTASTIFSMVEDLGR